MVHKKRKEIKNWNDWNRITRFRGWRVIFIWYLSNSFEIL